MNIYNTYKIIVRAYGSPNGDGGDIQFEMKANSIQYNGESVSLIKDGIIVGSFPQRLTIIYIKQ